MADFKNHVDENGVRLAPKPMEKSGINVLPAVRQDLIITPSISADESDLSNDGYDDYQPEKASSKDKRRRRGKNMIVGAIMLVTSLAVLLEYLLPLADVWLENDHFQYVPTHYSAIVNVIRAFRFTADNGWTGDAVKFVWQQNMPNVILSIGILFVIVNIIKSLFGLFAAVRPQKYAYCAAMYLIMVLAILIMSVAGVPMIGMGKIDFVNEVIRGYKTSELFALAVIALGYFIISSAVSLINSDKSGYLK